MRIKPIYKTDGTGRVWDAKKYAVELDGTVLKFAQVRAPFTRRPAYREMVTSVPFHTHDIRPMSRYDRLVRLSFVLVIVSLCSLL